MADYYAESSVLIKWHVPEIGTPWVRSLTDPVAGNLVVTARITIAEVYSAFNRRLRERGLDVADYRRIAGDFEMISATEYIIVDITGELIRRTRRLLESYVLRGYDAIQLAAALEARDQLLASGVTRLTFLSADTRLLAAARAEGFPSANPNDHP